LNEINKQNNQSTKQKQNEKKIYFLDRSLDAADNDFTADEVVGTNKNGSNRNF